MRKVDDFTDYKLLDISHYEKLEDWKGIILRRPEPTAIWTIEELKLWNDTHATYKRSNEGGGHWEINKKVPDTFNVSYHDYKFNLKLMGFKHTGLFPEQATNWNLLEDTIKKSNRHLKVLNLFAYTGAASVVALKNGASVVHVDSSRGMVDWAKENVNLNKLGDKDIHYFVDDVKKFVKREIRRGNKYDIIIMDPPSFGRGSKNEVWNIEKDLYDLVNDTTKLLNNDFKLYMINSYSTGLSRYIMEDLLYKTVNKEIKGVISSDEIGIPVYKSNIVLPCGATSIWQNLED